MIEDALDGRIPHTGMTVVFLSAWGLLVTVLNGPWLVRQGIEFRPPDRESTAGPTFEVVAGTGSR